MATRISFAARTDARGIGHLVVGEPVVISMTNGHDTLVVVGYVRSVKRS